MCPLPVSKIPTYIVDIIILNNPGVRREQMVSLYKNNINSVYSIVAQRIDSKGFIFIFILFIIISSFLFHKNQINQYHEPTSDPQSPQHDHQIL